MTTVDELQDSLQSFAQSCNENARLMAMIKDWNRIICVRASDLGAAYTLTTDSGAVRAAPGAPTGADLTIESTADLLTQIFYGELSPNEPYNDGTLRLQGAEDDIVRLDFVIAMLWE